MAKYGEAEKEENPLIRAVFILLPCGYF